MSKFTDTIDNLATQPIRWFRSLNGTALVDETGNVSNQSATGTVAQDGVALVAGDNNLSLDASSGHWAFSGATGANVTGDLTIVGVTTLGGSDLPSSGNRARLVVKAGPAENEINNFVYQLETHNNAGVLEVRAFHENGAGVNNLVTNLATMPTDEVVVQVLRRDATAKTYQASINGVHGTAGGYANNPTGGGIAELNISGNDGADRWPGEIGEVLIYNALLSDAEIEAISAAVFAGTLVYANAGSMTSTSITVTCRTDDASAVRLAISASSDMSSPTYADSATPTGLGMAKLTATGLTPGTRYYWAVEVDGTLATTFRGKFDTPTSEGTAHTYRVAIGCCAGNTNAQASTTDDVSDHPIFDAIRTGLGDLAGFYHLGDMHYKNITLDNNTRFRDAINEVFATRQGLLYSTWPIEYVYDDHDRSDNDGDEDSVSGPAAATVLSDSFAHYPLALDSDPEAAPLARTWVIGRVRYIMTDLRAAKSPKTDIDSASKTMIGTNQKIWLKATLLAASEPVIVWLNTSQWRRDDNDSDTWEGYATERTELADFFEDNDLTRRLLIACGDWHGMGFDDGSATQYATGASTNGPSLVQVGSLDSAPSSYAGYTYSNGKSVDWNQVVTLDIVDNGGSTINVTAKAWKYNSVDGDLDELFDMDLAFAAPTTTGDSDNIAAIREAVDLIASGVTVVRAGDAEGSPLATSEELSLHVSQITQILSGIPMKGQPYTVTEQGGDTKTLTVNDPA